MKTKKLSPKEFLRARRPEKFSDSVIEQMPILDRSMLEYHLDTLTNRKQETKFESFARRLAEQIICPNLLPQTGPTGGGDSKVDAETYPVADSLSLIWYIGIGVEAASERWAFAFSAKKAWQGKVRDDIRKIVETGRDYKKAFFISNQFISDKNRAKIEDELSRKYNLDVRILDRTWILDEIFKNKLEPLVIKELELEISLRREIQKGPLDIQRERELEALEKKIDDFVQHGRYNFNLAKDCLEAAIYSRQLEHPRIEIDGRFDRAERVAQKCGMQHQILECAYEKAWTTYWWHEDYKYFPELYGIVEERAKGSRNVYDLELLTNLWFLLYGMRVGGKFPNDETLFEDHTKTLLMELDRLSKEENRLSTALQAKTLFLQVQLALKQYRKEPLDEILYDLQRVIQQAESLPGYPLEPIVEILTELGDFLDGIPAYETLFETIVNIRSAHNGEISAARMLLKRGEQQLNGNRPNEAIRSLGRTFVSLYKYESRNDAIFALYLCGCAYERLGLLWAAHGTLVNAASLAVNDFWKYGEITPLQAACYSRLKWIELQLGRLPHILNWHQTDQTVRVALVEQGYEKLRLIKRERDFDIILGILLLKTNILDLKKLTRLPDVLEELGLGSASTALIYALGQEEELTDENYRKIWGNEDLKNVILKLYDQPVSDDLPEKPTLYNENKVHFESKILGCEIKLESENDSPCIELAESLLAALESILSTGATIRMAAREPLLSIIVRKSEFAKSPFEFNLQDDAGKPKIIVACSRFDPHNMPIEKQVEIRKILLELITSILARIIMIPELEKTLHKLFYEEHGLDRSLSFTGSFVTLGNVLGYTPKTHLTDWLNPELREYHLVRTEPWNADILRSKEETNQKHNKPPHLTPGREEPPKGLFDPEQTKHSQMKTVSLIRENLWNKAEWFGTGFLMYVDQPAPPVLTLVFKNPEAAKEIFAQWRNELGIRDEKEQLRITIIRGITKKNPYSYRVIISSNPDLSLSDQNIQYAFFLSRLNMMEPSSSENLERFLSNYNAIGQYFFAPATAKNDLSGLEPFLDHHITKREIFIRQAWEIGINDLDSIGIQSNDDPIIPEGQKNPPVTELLRQKRH